MKKIRITWNGELLREVYPHATRWQVFKYRLNRFMRRAAIVTGSLLLLSGIVATSYAFGEMATSAQVVTITADDAAVPVLNRIAACESGASQYDKTGQVLMHWNKNATVDVGKYAINSVWFKEATKQGLNLTSEADNLKMALWIYHNRGTSDWSASVKCWAR